MAKLVSNVYGDALFELAVEEKKDKEFFDQAQDLIKVLQTNPEFSQMMNHPKINKEDKLQIVENIFKGRISDEMVGLIKMMVEKGHANDIEKTLEYFISKCYELNNKGIAYVSTAIDLNDGQKAEVEKKLIETTKYSQFDIIYKVDPELIGGMVIRIGDRVVDSSIKTQIMNLSRELSNIQLKVGECAP